MKKHGIFLTGILILLTSFVSAYSYSSSSIANIFEMWGPENIMLLIVFSVSFALFTVILNRTGFFGESKGPATVIALMLSLGVTYGAYRGGFTYDFSGSLSSLGISDFALDIMIFLVTIILLIFFFAKLKSNALLVIGGFMLASYIIFGLSFEIGAVGGVLILVWIFYKIFSFRWKNTVYTRDLGGGRSGFRRR